MSKKSSSRKKTKSRAGQQDLSGPWISMRTGIRVIALASIFMAVLTTWQAIPIKGTLMGIVYGLLFGGMIWVIFLVFYLYGKYVRK